MKSKLYPKGFLSTVAAGFTILIGSMTLFHNSGIDLLSRCSAEALPSVTVENSSQWNATIYKIAGEDCAIEWIARTAETGVIQIDRKSLSDGISIRKLNLCVNTIAITRYAHGVSVTFLRKAKDIDQKGTGGRSGG